MFNTTEYQAIIHMTIDASLNWPYIYYASFRSVKAFSSDVHFSLKLLTSHSVLIHTERLTVLAAAVPGYHVTCSYLYEEKCSKKVKKVCSV